MKRRILFLSHSASRNGASILLLQFLQWMKRHTDDELHVICVGGGPLVQDYRTVAKTWVLRNPGAILRAFPSAWATTLSLRIEIALFRLLMLLRRYDLVYANTAATWRQVAALPDRAVPLLWHVHEMPYALQILLGDQRPSSLFPLAGKVVAVSQSVVKALTGMCSVAHDQIDLVHGFVAETALNAEERNAAKRRILSQLQWPDDTFVVGGCGVLDWRKGADLFLQIASRLKCGAESRKIRFLWVGGHANDLPALQFAHDLKVLGLEDICMHVAARDDVRDYYATMDVFALTSREDPYPLVMLEAGMQGVPTVCFAEAGGGPEYVGSDAGVIVPYLDVSSFAAAVQDLHDSPLRLSRLGEAARRKVRLGHLVEHQAPKLLESMERCMAVATSQTPRTARDTRVLSIEVAERGSAMDNALTVSVVIVSWNASKYLEECLLSLDEASYPWPIQIIVVDNASSDDSSAMVRARFPHVKLIQNSANLGFGKANNIGIRASTGKYVALVNSDVHVLHDCLQQLVSYAEANPRAGIVGPHVIGGDGKQQISYRGFPRLWNMFCRALALDRLFPNVRLFTGYLSSYRVLQSPTPVEILSGCFMVVKREAITAVGLFDEAFFIYGEDMDWCKRFGQEGWSVVFVPSAQSIHYGGGSSSNSPVRFFVEMQRADLQYWRKHHSRLAVAAYLGISVLHHVLRIFGHWLASIVARNQSGSHLQRAQCSSMCLRWMLSNARAARAVS